MKTYLQLGRVQPSIPSRLMRYGHKLMYIYKNMSKQDKFALANNSPKENLYYVYKYMDIYTYFCIDNRHLHFYTYKNKVKAVPKVMGEAVSRGPLAILRDRYVLLIICVRTYSTYLLYIYKSTYICIQYIYVVYVHIYI
jgi:hypothetical protein